MKRYLKKAPIFGDLSEEQLERIAGVMREESRHKGDVLFTPGAPGTALYLIQSGWVRLVTDTGINLATLGEGSLLGESDMLASRSHSTGATVVGEATLWSLSAEKLADLVAEEPALGVAVSEALGQRIAILSAYILKQRVQTQPALASLPGSAQEQIASRLQLMRVIAGTPLFVAGAQPAGLYILEKGSVQLGDESALGPGDMLGELALVSGKGSSMTAQALTDAMVWLLPADEFLTLKQQYPALSTALCACRRERLSATDRSAAIGRLHCLPLFADLSDEALAEVAGSLLLQHLPASATVYRRGDIGDALYLIETGAVSLFSEKAGDALGASVESGDFFGEASMLTGRPRAETAQANADTNLWVLPRADFERLVQRYPGLSLALSRALSERLLSADRHQVEPHLRKLALLSGLAGKQLKDISSRLEPAHFRAGAVILRENESGDVMYLIGDGEVEVEAGPERTQLAILGEGDFFGEMALLTGRPRTATVRAATDLEAWALRKSDFDDLLLKYPALTIMLSKVLGQRLNSANARLTVGSVRPTPARPATPVASPAEPGLVMRDRRAPVQRTGAPAPEKASPGFGLQKSMVSALEGLRHALDNAAAWFGTCSRPAKVRLVAVALLIAWLCGIAAPAALISSLAARNVNLGNALSLSLGPESEPVSAEVLAQISEPTVTFTLEPSATFTVEPSATPQPTDTPQPTATETALPPATETPVPATPTATYTPLSQPAAKVAATQQQTAAQPTAAPVQQAAAVAVAPQPPRGWDSRLDAMGVRVSGIDVPAGQTYWRIVDVKWGNEEESQGKHHIYVDTLDENGGRMVGQKAIISWMGGQDVLTVEDKPAPEFGGNFPMYAVLGTYSLRIDGLPSESLLGLGMGTPELPAWKIHTTFYVKFQKAIR